MKLLGVDVTNPRYVVTLLVCLTAHGPALAGRFQLREGNGGTQGHVYTVSDHQNRVVRKGDWGFTNDEARSVRLQYAKPGTWLRVFDDSDGRTNDDWAEIYVRKAARDIVIPTFQQNADNEYYWIRYYRKNGLDGKVSRVQVIAAPYPARGATAAERLDDLLAPAYSYWPHKKGEAYEHTSQNSNYRVWIPEISEAPDGSLFVSAKLDHIRGWATDDHAIITLRFTRDGMLQSADSTIILADDRVFTASIEAARDLAEVINSKEGRIAVASVKLAQKLYVDLLSLGEGGGRAHFPAVVGHHINHIGMAGVAATR